MIPTTPILCLLITASALTVGAAWAQAPAHADSVNDSESTRSPTSPTAPNIVDAPEALPKEAPDDSGPSSLPPSRSTDLEANSAIPPAASTKSSLQEEPETLLGPHYKVGGFGGLGVMYTRFANTEAVQVCGEGALLLNHVFSIGMGGCGIARTLKTTSFDDQAASNYRTSFGYGGGLIRYHFYSHRYANLAIATLIGAGAVASGDWDYRHNRYSGDVDDPDLVFVFEPQLAGYLNVTRWLRIGATAGYRFVSSSDTPGLKSSDLAAPTLGGQIQAGWF